MANSPSRKASRRLPTSDTIARHLARSKLDVCPDTNRIRGIWAAGFDLRIGVETELSVNHLEHFAGTRTDQLRLIKRDLIAAGRGVGGTSAFGVIDLNSLSEIGDSLDHKLHAAKRAEPNNPSHSEIFGLPPQNDAELSQRLADEAFRNLVEVKKL